MRNKQDASGGDNSTVNQAGGNIINNYYGIDYRTAREISLDAFNENIYKLSEKAAAVATQRAEELMDNFLSKLEEVEKQMPGLINKTQDPDIQYAVINAQKQYARRGEKESLDLLTNLLLDRFKAEDGSLKSIVLNECIELMPKLTNTQIVNVTIIFLVKYCALPKYSTFINTLYRIHNSQSIEINISDFEHLMYSGVISNDITINNHQRLSYFKGMNYDNKLDDYDTSIENHVTDIWESPLSDYSLTSVGKAIALSYYNAIMDADIPLDTWIKG